MSCFYVVYCIKWLCEHVKSIGGSGALVVTICDMGDESNQWKQQETINQLALHTTTHNQGHFRKKRKIEKYCFNSCTTKWETWRSTIFRKCYCSTNHHRWLPALNSESQKLWIYVFWCVFSFNKIRDLFKVKPLTIRS